jgi:carbamoyltransferase
LTLGLNQDSYDCGVTLTDDHRVLFAANEERYCRRKNQGGFPWLSMEGLFAFTNIDPSDIDRISIAGEMTPPIPMRMFPHIHRWIIRCRRESQESYIRHIYDFVTFYTPLAHTSETSIIRRMTRSFLEPVIRRSLPKTLHGIPIDFVEHHFAHAAAAWHLSGFEEGLCITADGMGDGLSLTVNRCSPLGIRRLWSIPSRSSIGLFFETLTEALGFTPCRDEGKITGLAARGNAGGVNLPSPFQWINGYPRYTGSYGHRGVKWAKKNLVERFSREDISAWAQNLLENFVLDIARYWLKETGLRKLSVGGGVFANVKLNQRLHQMNEVDEVFVCPNMGDGGLSLGCICAKGGLARKQLENVFWGESFSESEVENALRRKNLRFFKRQQIEKDIATLLVKGNIVARFVGRMEWGPRALGNRSILAEAGNHAVGNRLNTLLRRNDFMPFAPAVLSEDAQKYLIGLNSAWHTAEFMTACFDCTHDMKNENPAVVHIDGTARAQIVRQATNPRLYRILKEHKRLGGRGVLLNTSFNIHEEPIVRIPEEAVSSFLRTKIDYLAIENFLIPGDHIQSAWQERTDR